MNINVFGCRFGRCILYQRYLVAIMCSVCYINVMSLRYTIRVTVPFVTNRTHTGTNKTALCGKMEEEEHMQLVPQIPWTEDEVNLIHTSFYFPYIIAHFPSAILCDMYGPRHVLSFGILLSCLTNLMTPTAMQKMPWWFMLIMRQFIGVGQGVSMTAAFSLVSNWTPYRQVSTLCSLAYSGTAMGQVVLYGTMYIFFKLIGSWVAFFYFWSGITLAWYCLYLCLIFSSPSTHPFVSKEEKDLIVADLGVGYPKSIPWKAILSDNSVWALLSGQIGHTWILFILVTNLPKYFHRVLGFHVLNNLSMQTLPNLCMWVMMICGGLLGDHLINRNILPAVYLRIIYTAIGNLLPSIFILIAMYIDCHRPVLLLFCMLAMICKGTIVVGLKANILDITRHYVGIIYAFQNGLGAVAGLALPYTVRYMCRTDTKEEWRKVFWLSFAITTFTTMLFFIWCRSDRASWDTIDHSDR